MSSKPRPTAVVVRNLLLTMRRPRPGLTPCGGGWRRIPKPLTDRNY